MRTEVDAAAARVVEVFAEKEWLPHAAALTFVDGEWYRVEARRLEPIPGSEDWFVDPDDD